VTAANSAHRRLAQQNALRALRSELAVVRVQPAKLATLGDHYRTEAEELRALLAHRDRDLATGDGRRHPTVVCIHRSARRPPSLAVGAHKSPSRAKLSTFEPGSMRWSSNVNSTAANDCANFFVISSSAWL